MTNPNDENSDSIEERNKLADQLAALEPLLMHSLCLRCKSHRTVVSGKGSVFMLCQSTQTPTSWPKYPPQPMRQCAHFVSEIDLRFEI